MSKHDAWNISSRQKEKGEDSEEKLSHEKKCGKAKRQK